MSSTSRRHSHLAGLTIMAALGLAVPVSAQAPASPLESEFLFEMRLDVDAQVDAGHNDIVPVTGGTFSGPELHGTVRPGGADWLTDGSGHRNLNVRILLETDDGALIAMAYTGVLRPGPDGLYWRVRPVFTTASEEHDWLNHIVAIGKGRQEAGAIVYDVFRIL